MDSSILSKEMDIMATEYLNTAEISIDEEIDQIANDIANPSFGFSSEQNQVIIISKQGSTIELNDSKTNIARKIIPDLINGI